MSEATTKKTVAKKRGAKEERFDVELGNPWLAGFLAWLVPGLGHWRQGRRAKAIIFAAAIWPILLAGLWMGSYWEATPNGESARRLLIARNVYASWRQGDKRLYFIPQAAIGAVAIPAIWQARNPADGDGVLTTAFAPPRISSEAATRPNQPSADEIVANLHSWLDVGTIFTVVAGLLNLLAIFDAAGGPVPPSEEEEEDDGADENDGEEKTK